MTVRSLWIASAILWALYGIALVAPAITWNGGPYKSLRGYEALFGGWDWPGTLPESANLALLVGWMSLFACKPRIVLACGSLGILLATTAPFIYADASHPGWRSRLWRAADVSDRFTDGGVPTHLGWGYWFWLGSIATLFFVGVYSALTPSQTQTQHRPTA